jgi:hypothetical protein
VTEPSVTTTEGRAALRERMAVEDWDWSVWLELALNELETVEHTYRTLVEVLGVEQDLRGTMQDLLVRTANALKGEPHELIRHSWQDLPEVARRLMERNR